MRRIEKKIWPKYFQPILDGKKNYEFRLQDFDVEEGDILFLREWDPELKDYTGRELEKKVTYVGKFDIKDGFFPVEEVLDQGIYILSLK